MPLHRLEEDPFGEPSSSPPSPEMEAERILEEARGRAIQVEREAFEKGFAQGERAGREIAEKAAESSLRALQAAYDRLLHLVEIQSREAEEQIVRLALAVARKILHVELRTQPEALVGILHDALSRLDPQDEVVVRVHPMDLEMIQQWRSRLIQGMESVRSLRIEEDEGLSRGDAVVECSLGELDLRIDRQIQEIEKAFNRILIEGTGERTE